MVKLEEILVKSYFWKMYGISLKGICYGFIGEKIKLVVVWLNEGKYFERYKGKYGVIVIKVYRGLFIRNV